ncbi:iron uptake transporter permease EfeU [Rhizobium halophytocola]|uniref:High-affinity iron transporter n=1 Tax=Rhizobium halophytocola TaxID=735519 RepID=A0ABS4DU61_9HYPH|nr:iron uptake transporter permease EfeU [Rhizobium halophytocola]MBP1849240.1 high-affinity iron transporter [Rhizobium halophytocola]
MLAPFLIMLREGIEAALITGIIASYLRHSGRSQWLPAVWIGVFLAIAVSLFVGAVLQLVSAEFPQKAQELFEAFVGLIAVVVLVSMVTWMRKAARTMKAGLQGSVDQALAQGSGASLALIGMVFFSVAREGVESVFFLLAVFQQSQGMAAPLGALLGMVVALIIGLAIYGFGVRINLRRFFQWTGLFILVVAAGLLSAAIGSLHEAGLWNGLQTPAYDLSHALPVSSLFGTLLSGVFNYQEAPTIGQSIAWGLFLAITFFLFLRPVRVSGEKPLTPAAGEPQNVRV